MGERPEPQDGSVEPKEGDEAPRAAGCGKAAGGAWAEKIGVPIFVAVLVTFGSFMGTTLANGTARDNTAAELREQRSQADREKRVEVYKAVFVAAEDYADKASILNYCLLQRPPIPPGKGSIPPVCTDDLTAMFSAKRAFDGARVDLNTYGSRAANDVVTAWAAAFPDLETERFISGCEELDQPTSLPVVVTSIPWRPDRHVAQREAFRSVMCRELPAEPRDNC
ncbi:MAG: hypothetical protein AB7L91_17510 [Dehalococcoidia bacterium]